ncbi:hypothetical protein AB0I81_62095 [Nonomuraea sp. NPDC050404]|uniref:hypothetical protein n=1 Tax=Nonomuraea sp. NPDC050404 TaxID=3155783 RepID=UPI0033E05D85
MFTRTITTTLAAAGLALAALTTAAGTAAADTNRSDQTSNVSGPTASLLSPGGHRPGNGQANRQRTDKAHTSNWSIIDYFGGCADAPFSLGIGDGEEPRLGMCGAPI